MPRMSEINRGESKYFKVGDLEEQTGQKWQTAQLPVVVEAAAIGEYPARDNEPAQPAFLLKFQGIDKPLGCNVTNRRTLEQYVGDVEWDTASLRGLRLTLYADNTSMGAGMRLRIHPEQIHPPFAPINPKLQAQPPQGEEPPPPNENAFDGADDDQSIPL